MALHHTISHSSSFPVLIMPDDNKGAIMAVIYHKPGQSGV